MPLQTGFTSTTQRDRFHAAGALYVRGGPLARTCGAKLRTGATCTQLALAGEARCSRHGGPDAARRYRDRQFTGLQTGRVTPDEWARAEARRARNALAYAWTKNPSLPGATIDLGPQEAAFRAATASLGVDVTGLYPAVADWLRWQWLRYQKDRHNWQAWERVVKVELPRRVATADTAMDWVRLGGVDKRTALGRALKGALRGGGIERAQALALRLGVALPARAPMTLVLPWIPPPAGGTGKRAQPNRPKAAAAPQPQPPRPIGRPSALPDDPDSLLALGEVLRAAGTGAQDMFAKIEGHEDQLRFLMALRDVTADSNSGSARGRWGAWVARLRMG
jgi:hypothetical protein